MRAKSQSRRTTTLAPDAVPGPSGPGRVAPAPAVRHSPLTRRWPVVGRTRTGGWWVALVAAAVVLLLLLIFVLQNGARARVSFLGAHAALPLGIALLLAAIAGVLIVAIPGTGRILQLRHLARRPAQTGPPGPSGPQPAAGPAMDTSRDTSADT